MLRVVGELIEQDRRGRYNVRQIVEALKGNTAMQDKMVESLGGAEYSEDLEGLFAALAKANGRGNNVAKYWKCLSFANDDSPPPLPAKDKEELVEIVAQAKKRTIEAHDVQTLATALLAVQGNPSCERNIRSLLMSAVHDYANALEIGSSRSGFGVSERAKQLGISLDGQSASVIGKQAAALYREQYGNADPPARWVDDGREAYFMNVYDETTAPQTLDLVLQEIAGSSKKKRRK